MESNQLTNALVDAAAAAKPAQEYCVALMQQEWWSCMTKTEWSGWMQAFGSILALAIAIGVPWCERRRKKREDVQKAADDANITIRFHSEVFETNEGLIRVIKSLLLDESRWTRVDAQSEVLNSVRSLRAVDFAQIRTISAHDPALAQHLADFHCQLDFLLGILDRNTGNPFEFYAKSVLFRTMRLDQLADHIKSRTTP